MMSDIFDQLLHLELCKRIIEQEEEIKESLQNKYAKFIKLKNKYLELYSALTKIVAAHKEIETVSKISKGLDDCFPPERTINIDDVKNVSKLIGESFIEYLPPDLQLDINHQQQLLQNRHKIEEHFQHVESIKRLKNIIEETILKTEINLTSITPKGVDTLSDGLSVEFQ